MSTLHWVGHGLADLSPVYEYDWGHSQLQSEKRALARALRGLAGVLWLDICAWK